MDHCPEPPLDDVVICTRNRPSELARCLTSVYRQSRSPAQVTIVDSSDGKATEELVAELEASGLSPPCRYLRSAPGLTRQRNAAVSSTTAQIVHFIDDDVVLDDGYIAAVLAVFERDVSGQTLGVGGLVTNAHHERPSMFKRFFGLYGNTPGQVLRSGRNVLAVDVESDLDVEWLSGCSMSYRRIAFEGRSFDESLPGYGLGEDLDFSYRVAQIGRLVVTASARLVHLQSPLNRLTSVEYTRDELITRARRVRQRVGRTRMAAYWWSVLGQVLALALTSCKAADREVSQQRLWTTVRTAADVAKSGLRRPVFPRHSTAEPHAAAENTPDGPCRGAESV